MIIFCLGVLLIAIRTEAFTVLGPAMPLVVQTGRSVTLPCSADTPLPTLDLEVQWMREDSGSIVHMFQEGESRPEFQSPSYRGRAEFFSEEISKGNFSLLLINVTSKDKGLYKCVVLSDQESHETTVKIDIEHLTVTGAVEPVFAYAGEDVILNCTVDTHVPVGELQVQWIKIDGEILVLLFDEGESRPESQDERFRGRAEFFSEEIPKGNFSMKLRDVKTEDRGEFMCRVDTDIESVQATAWLQEEGFSTLKLCILGLSFAAAVFAVLSCIPAVRRMKREMKIKDKGSRAGRLYFLQVSIPCILIFIAFIIWGTTEGSVGEAWICGVVNLLRILVVFRVAPFKFPGKCFERLTNMAVALEMFVLTTVVNSVVLYNFLTQRGGDTTTAIANGLFLGIISFRTLSAVGMSGLGISSGSAHIEWVIDYEVLFLVFTRSTSSFTAVFLIWFIEPGVRYTLMSWLNDLRGSRYAYLWHKSLETLKFILVCAIYLLLLALMLDKDKEFPGIMCFIVFLYIIKAIMKFNYRSDLPDVPHILVYVFGSAGLSFLNSVALAMEVFLKAEKGQRIVEDLRMVILLLESLFLACWLALQIYAFCKEDKVLTEQLKLLFPCCKKQGQSPASQQNQSADKKKKFSDEDDEDIKKIVEKVFPGMLAQLLPRVLAQMQTPAVAEESVSPPAPRTTENQEGPDGAEEMNPLSLPAPTTEHRQEIRQDAIEMEPLFIC
ncbi:hypothetical protein GJAV_G00048610 [Gymnothorax javanicus]|nr:hypothetical protein GJAV_G00048610 [Gymnothorax javanicus]